MQSRLTEERQGGTGVGRLWGATWRRNNRGWLAVLGSLLLCPLLVEAQRQGDLDTSFGIDGTVFTDFGNSGSGDPQALVLQPDGKIIVAGGIEKGVDGRNDFFLVRYRPDGTLDTTFDGDGIVTTDFGGFDGALDVVLQPDGKIVVAGETLNISGPDNFALARYKPNGSLDTTFDGDGKVTTNFGGFDGAFAVALQPDGKIVVAGTGEGPNPQGPPDIVLARYRSNGALDSTFGHQGKVISELEVMDRGTDVLLQSDGKIVVAGWGQDRSSEPETGFILIRYLPNGSLDTSFGDTGLALFDVKGNVIATAVALQPDDKIVVSGGGGRNGFVLARYLPNGKLDKNFGGVGWVATPFEGNATANALAIQPHEGRLVAAGYFNPGISNNFQSYVVVARYHAIACGVTVVTRVGTAGNDTIVGTSGPDVIYGFDGNDLISGLGGNDILCGGKGNDTLRGSGGDDILRGGPGTDTCDGGPGNADQAADCEAMSNVP